MITKEVITKVKFHNRELHLVEDFSPEGKLLVADLMKLDPPTEPMEVVKCYCKDTSQLSELERGPVVSENVLEL